MATETQVRRGDEDRGPDRLSGVLRALVRRPVALLLLLMMIVGSLLLWIGIPFAWIWGVSHMVKSSQPSLGPYVVVLIGMPVTMWLMGKFLYRLNYTYSRVTGRHYEVRVRLPWHKSLRDSSDPSPRASVLEVVMIASVSVALLAFGIWFFFFAGSSIPNA